MDAPDLNPLLDHAVPYTLVMFRLAGVFLLAPLLTSLTIPRIYKALLLFMLAAALYPAVQSAAPAIPRDLDLFGLVPLVVMESLIGLAIGGIAALPLLSLEMAGVLIGQNMGLGLAKVYNPEADFESDVVGQLIYYIGATIFLCMGGLELLFAGIMKSFTTIPLGGFAVSQTPLDLFVATLTSGFELAVRISMPVTAIVMLVIVVMGLIGKTMPQLNVMSVGFAIKIIAGTAMLAASLYAIQGAVGDEITRTLAEVLRWVSAP
jgi:flagellar biosynthetic protein FliR